MSIVLNGTTGITAPAVEADVNLPNGGPAFSAYASTNQSFSASTWTKVTFGTEEFDTNSNFASSRFTPTVAGYYQINASIFISYSVNGPTIIRASIYKNGAGYRIGISGTSGVVYQSCGVSDVVYLNGSTDYVEVYAWSNSASAYVVALEFSTPSAFFSAALVRAA